MKNNQGITLIALVITIIVMLILVAVTITIAVNGGLFNYAQEAGRKTNEAKDLEQEYANLGEYEDYGFSTDYEYLIDKYAVKEIHFTIRIDPDTTLEYTAIKDMKWREWVESDYSKKYPEYTWVVLGIEGDPYPAIDEIGGLGPILNGEDQYIDDIIIDNTEYGMG